jgi:hypothetical protein
MVWGSVRSASYSPGPISARKPRIGFTGPLHFHAEEIRGLPWSTLQPVSVPVLFIKSVNDLSSCATAEFLRKDPIVKK